MIDPGVKTFKVRGIYRGDDDEAETPAVISPWP